MLIHKYVDQNSSTAILATRRSAGIVAEVNLSSPLYAGDKIC